MSRHDDTVRVQHMLDHAVEALELIRSKNREDLDKDRVLNLALVRLLEIIGEAASKVSPEYRDKYPEVPWYPIIGLRNRLIHGYDDVDFNIMWSIVKDDLPPLINALRALI